MFKRLSYLQNVAFAQAIYQINLSAKSDILFTDQLFFIFMTMNKEKIEAIFKLILIFVKSFVL